MAQGFPASMHRTGLAAEAMSFLQFVVAAASRPANLLAVLVVFFGWAALISWTGNSPAGWQARICAGSGMAARACIEILPLKDQSRVAPHDAGLKS